MQLNAAALALVQFDKSIAADARLGEAHVGRGDALMILRRQRDAALAYEAACGIDATHALWHLKHAHALAVIGNTDAAQQAYARAVARGAESLPGDLFAKVTKLLPAPDYSENETELRSAALWRVLVTAGAVFGGIEAEGFFEGGVAGQPGHLHGGKRAHKAGADIIAQLVEAQHDVLDGTVIAHAHLHGDAARQCGVLLLAFGEAGDKGRSLLLHRRVQGGDVVGVRGLGRTGHEARQAKDKRGTAQENAAHYGASAWQGDA